MKIGIDLRTVEGGSEYRGIGRYVYDLLENMLHDDHKNEYVFFYKQDKDKFARLKLPKDCVHQFVQVPNSKIRTTRFIRFLFLRDKPLKVDDYDLDVFFAPDVFQSFSTGKTPFVAVLYDLIPFIFKDDYQQITATIRNPISYLVYWRAKGLWWRRKRDLLQFRRATYTVSISEHSKKDLIKMITGVDPDRVIAIPLAAGTGIVQSTSRQISKRLTVLRDQQFVFYVGGSDPRKGLVDLVRAMPAVWTKLPNMRLVLAGKELGDNLIPSTAQLTREISTCKKPGQVLNLGFISDDELEYLYSHAQAFIFPSKYEGFGLPILEAMKLGCPVITLNNSSIPEVAGNAAILVSNNSELSNSIIEIATDQKLRSSMIKEGLAQDAKFTWEKTAARTLAVLEKAAQNPETETK